MWQAVQEAGEARRHWQEYLRLDPNSSWARRVRERLGEEPAPPEP